MTLQINSEEFNFTHEDAIAYEFFMESIGKLLDGSNLTGNETVEAITATAKASYLIAEIFSCARKEYKARHIEDGNDSP
jgi:hypothetical protein